MKNVSVSEAQTLKKPIFCNVRLEKKAHIKLWSDRPQQIFISITKMCYLTGVLMLA